MDSDFLSKLKQRAADRGLSGSDAEAYVSAAIAKVRKKRGVSRLLPKSSRSAGQPTIRKILGVGGGKKLLIADLTAPKQYKTGLSSNTQ